MSAAQLRLELLLGRKITDAAGERIGRIEEIVAETDAGECHVVEYHVGSVALLESIGGRLGSSLLRLAWPGSHRGYVVSWEQMDLRDPDHPRVTCNRAALRPL